MKKSNALNNKPIQLVIPPAVRKELSTFLIEKSNDGREAYACLLCGSHNQKKYQRLLTRHLFLPDDDCFTRREAGGLQVRTAFDNLFLSRAEEEGLIPVQVHTHLHTGQPEFSMVDDRCELNRAMALQQKLGLPLVSCVFDKKAEYCRARFWKVDSIDNAEPVPMSLITSVTDAISEGKAIEDPRFDRQVRAFGLELQSKLDKIRVGIVGLGGTGAIVAEGLARLGVRHFVLVDPDHVEISNLNRLIGATAKDAKKQICKVNVAYRNIQRIHGNRAKVSMVSREVPDQKTAHKLAACDVLIAATDNHSSRLYLQEIGSAFLRPVINLGVGLVAREQKIKDINGRIGVAHPGGSWCLYCGGHINAEAAAKEKSDREHLDVMRQRGYLKDTPAPAVYWINMHVASYALAIFHQVVMPFGPSSFQSGEDVFTDILRGEQFHLTHRSGDFDCVVCSPGGLRGIGDGYFSKYEVSEFEPLNLKAKCDL